MDAKRLRRVLFGIGALIAFLMQNSAESIREAICSWGLVGQCEKVVTTALLVKLAGDLLIALLAFLAADLLIGLVRQFYLHSMAKRMGLVSPSTGLVRAGDSPEPKFIPLHEATLRAYEETEGTLSAYAAELRPLGGERNVLSWFANALVGSNREIPIYGKSPPSRIRRRILPTEFSRCDFSNDARTLIRRGEDEAKFEELEIKESDFLQRLEVIKDWGASFATGGLCPIWEFSGDKQATHFQDGRPVTFYRIKVENIGPNTVTGATGYVVDVEKNRVPQRFKETVQLTFAPGEADDALSKTLRPGIPEFLDVAFLASDGCFGLGTKGRFQLNSVKEIFNAPAEYKFTIKVAGDNVQTETMKVLLHLTGDRATTEMECLKDDT